jgi:type I restriction enzyme M protein
VSKPEIEENDYDLSLSKYKVQIYDEMKYEEPKNILSRLKANEQSITNAINELDSFIK